MRLNKKQIWTIVILLIIIVAIIGIVIYQKSKKEPVQRIISEMLTTDANDILFGNDSAQLAVYMYASYNCSYCRKFFTDVLPELQEDFIDTKKVKIILRLTSRTIDKRLKRALKAQVCVSKYGNYQYLHELLLNDDKIVYTDDFQKMITEFAEKDPFIGECIDGSEANSYLLRNLEEFDSLKFKGTPTFVIGNVVYPGYRDAKAFNNILNKHL